MGTFKPGPMGVVNGLIDTVVTSKWKNVYVIKGRPTKSKKAATLKQEDQHMRFALVTSLLKRINPIIATGYQNAGKNLTPMNAAARYHLANAVKGTYPDYEMDFTKLKLSNGDEGTLDEARKAKVEVSAGAVITVSWLMQLHPTTISSVNDVAMILFYNEEKGRFTSLLNAAKRSELNREEVLPDEYAGDTIHSWIVMVSEDGKRIAESQYLGTVKLLA